MTDRAFCLTAHARGFLSFEQVLDLLLEARGEGSLPLARQCRERQLLTAAQIDALEQDAARLDAKGESARDSGRAAEMQGGREFTKAPASQADSGLAGPSHPKGEACPEPLPNVDMDTASTLHWQQGEASHRGIERGEDGALRLEEQAGRYLEQKELGRGGMGIVYRVRDDAMKRRVALKELLPDLAADDSIAEHLPDLRRRFVREAELTAALQHPGIVPVYEIGRRLASGEAYYTMKMVEGRTLMDAIRTARSLEERLALLPNFIDVCQTIAYAHRHGVVHRDIKPANIIIGEFGETYVLDWGLAFRPGEKTTSAQPAPPTGKPVDTNATRDSSLTQRGAGTPYYMAPEQALGRVEEIDARSDIYSLGAILFEILTGKKIKSYRDVTKLEALVSQSHAQPREVDLELSLPSELVIICKKAMALKKAQRFGDAKELAQAVAQVQTGAEIVLEQLAEAVHIAYVTERTAQGWRYGPVRDDARKENPTLIPYSELTEEEKELDRISARQTIQALRRLGFIVARERKLFRV